MCSSEKFEEVEKMSWATPEQRKEIGGQLKSARIEQGLTVRAVAEKAGIPLGTLGGIEIHGSCKEGTVDRICEVLDLNPLRVKGVKLPTDKPEEVEKKTLEEPTPELPKVLEHRAVKIRETWEVSDGNGNGRQAEITFSGGKFTDCCMTGMEKTGTYEDWLFLGLVASEIKRLQEEQHAD
jgi:transcriptional regulator with XRE-family HTH domain